MNELHVIAALAEITREMREEGRIGRTRVGALAGRSEDSVRRFERGVVAPHVDPMVNAIAEDAGISPVDLWMAAINRAALQDAAPDESVRFATELGDAAAEALPEPASDDGEPDPQGSKVRPRKRSPRKR